jgi:hypothetical protein
MTEQNESVDPSTFTTVREHRHYVRRLANGVASKLGSAGHSLAGVVGLTQEQQVERFDQANAAVTEATEGVGAVLTAIEGGKDLAATRDFAAHQAAKAARQQETVSFDRPADTEANEF